MHTDNVSGEALVDVRRDARGAVWLTLNDPQRFNALGEQIEHCFAEIARGLIDQQVRRFVVAGGETSGAVVNALGVQMLKIGDTIDPGVPWTSGMVGQPLLGTPAPVLLALKSGNFGTEDFFTKALALTERPA